VDLTKLNNVNFGPGHNGYAGLLSVAASDFRRYRTLYFRRQYAQVFGESGEEFSLLHVGSEFTDKRAVLCINAELFQMRRQILHRRLSAGGTSI
jgi:hypothetical protein